MGVRRELRLESVAGHEIMVGRDGKRRWSDELSYATQIEAEPF